jgi:hypothetical protein
MQCRPDPVRLPGELDHEQRMAAFAVNVLGALTAAAHIAPSMAAERGGTMITTGGMPEPALVSLSLGKAGVRALTAVLAKEFRTGVRRLLDRRSVGGRLALRPPASTEACAGSWDLRARRLPQGRRRLKDRGVATVRTRVRRLHDRQDK